MALMITNMLYTSIRSKNSHPPMLPVARVIAHKATNDASWVIRIEKTEIIESALNEINAIKHRRKYAK